MHHIICSCLVCALLSGLQIVVCHLSWFAYSFVCGQSHLCLLSYLFFCTLCTSTLYTCSLSISHDFFWDISSFIISYVISSSSILFINCCLSLLLCSLRLHAMAFMCSLPIHSCAYSLSFLCYFQYCNDSIILFCCGLVFFLLAH